MLLKRWWFGLSLITIVFLAVAAVSFLAPDPVERAKTKFQQIKEGMTKAQVIEVMGPVPAVDGKCDGSGAPFCVWKWKFGGDTAIVCVFDADLRVRVTDLHIDPRTFFEQIRDEIRDWRYEIQYWVDTTI
jgi:hypothetical protein